MAKNGTAPRLETNTLREGKGCALILHLVHFSLLDPNRNEYLKQKCNFLGSRARPGRRADNLTAIYEAIV
jgi:hypothetical protein